MRQAELIDRNIRLSLLVDKCQECVSVESPADKDPVYMQKLASMVLGHIPLTLS